MPISMDQMPLNSQQAVENTDIVKKDLKRPAIIYTETKERTMADYGLQMKKVNLVDPNEAITDGRVAGELAKVEKHHKDSKSGEEGTTLASIQ